MLFFLHINVKIPTVDGIYEQEKFHAPQTVSMNFFYNLEGLVFQIVIRLFTDSFHKNSGKYCIKDMFCWKQIKQKVSVSY